MRNLYVQAALAGALLLTSAVGCDKGDAKKDAPEGTASAAAKEAPPTPRPAPVKTSSALSHLPTDCQVAMHVDFTALMKHPELGPRIEKSFEEAKAAPKTAPGKPDDKQAEEAAKFDRVFHSLGIQAKDISDIALCLIEAPTQKAPEGRVMLAMGGKLPTNLIDLAKPKLEEEGVDKVKVATVQGHQVVRGPQMLAGQSKDGAIVVGTDEGALVAGLSAKAQKPKYPFEAGQAINIVLTEKGLGAIAAATGQTVPAESLGKLVDGVIYANVGSGKPGDPGPTLGVKLRGKDETAAKQLEAEFQQTRAQAKQQLAAAPEADPKMKALVDSAKITRDKTVVSATLELPADTIARLAAFLEQGLQQGMMMMPPGAMPPGGMRGGPHPGALPPHAMPPGQAPSQPTPPQQAPPTTK